MNNEHDDLEAELHSLRPHELSPGLPERIAASLAADRNVAWRRKLHGQLALLGGLVAASLLAIVLWPQGNGSHLPTAPVATPFLTRPSVVEEPLPTFRAYQRALIQSPEAVEALVDKYAALSLVANQSSKQMRAFPLTHSDVIE
jgi:hypothetical protein